MGFATEADIRHHATRLYEAAAATTPRLFDRKWWAGRLIVGAGIKEALPAVADLWKRGIAYSVDLLGEATVCEPEAEAYTARYHETITALAEAARESRPSPLLEADHLGPLPRTQVS